MSVAEPAGQAPGREEQQAPRTGNLFRDTLVVTRRNLRQLVRQPQLLVFVTVQPAMIVLLFNYVFGGAIGQTLERPGFDYIDFLLPGIVVQAIAFGTTTTSVGMAEDLTKGLIDRFRSLPMARSAVLAGRTLSDTARIAFVVLLVTGIGLVLGFSFRTSVPLALAAFALVVAFGLVFSVVAAWIGLMVSQPEAAQAAGFVWLFPLTFASGAFVPVDTLPDGLRQFAQINPITLTVDALRGLTTGGEVLEPLLPALAWFAGILLVFGPLAVRRYRRAG